MSVFVVGGYEKLTAQWSDEVIAQTKWMRHCRRPLAHGGQGCIIALAAGRITKRVELLTGVDFSLTAIDAVALLEGERIRLTLPLDGTITRHRPSPRHSAPTRSNTHASYMAQNNSAQKNAQNTVHSTVQAPLVTAETVRQSIRPFNRADVVVACTDLGRDVFLATMDMALKRGVYTMVHYGPSAAEDIRVEDLRGAHLIIARLEDINHLVDHQGPYYAQAALMRATGAAVLLTDKLFGCSYMHPDGTRNEYFGAKHELRDPTGASEIFTGALAGYLDQGLGMGEALIAAQAMAIRSTAVYGCVPGLPGDADLPLEA
ncbi:MAG: hypothetical protein Q3972_05860 [Corynebacterium sp.]|nr:hypothetical protein [Corynebacterium sp.]